MTAAFNLAQLANNLNTSGQLDATDGLTGSVPVANGGTGLATLTANNVILGNGTSAPTFVAPGASGNVLTSNGTTWQSGSATFGAFKYNLYTSGTATWTAPAGVSRVKVICIAGGGGGGGGDNDSPGGNGGFGGIAIGIYTVTPGTGYSVVVGSGGAANNIGNGSAGGNSSFGSTICSATGGAGGIQYSGADAAAGVGSNGITSNSNISLGAGGSFAGPSSRTNALSSTAAITWTSSTILAPGARGLGGNNPSADNATGGVGGVVYLEYVG